MLPEGWKRYPLHEVAEVRTGLAKGRTSFSDPVELPYLRVANVQDGHLDLKQVKTIKIERGQVSRYSLKVGDILMTEGGDFDKLGRGDVWDGQIPHCLHQNHVFAVRPNRNLLNPHFLAALAASEYGRLYFLSCAKRSTNLASINASQLKKFPVLAPPLREQEAISKVLGAWDAAIAITDRLLTNSRRQKQALTQLLLSDTYRKKNGLSQLARKRASDLFAQNSVRRNGKLELLSVMQDVGVVPRRSLDRKVVMPEGSTDGYKLVEPGNFVISLRSFEGGLEYSRHTGLVSPAYTVLKAKQQIDDNFYRHYFKSYEFIGRLSVAVIGIRDGKQISYEDFAFLNIPAPGIDEQRHIAEALNFAEAVVAMHESELRKLRVEKIALMQQLLTGKRRVRVPVAATETTPA